MAAEAETSDRALTKYVAGFIHGARVADLPADVVALGKKSILDGIGLALSGAVAESGDLGAISVLGIMLLVVSFSVVILANRLPVLGGQRLPALR